MKVCTPRFNYVLHRLSLMFIAAMPISGAYAAEISPIVAPRDLTSMNNLLQVTLGLFIVLALILATAWVVRRSGAARGLMNGQLRVLGALSMGQRERVVLVQVGETQLLVGVAPGQVRMLHVLDKPVVSSMNATSSAVGSDSAFRSALAEASAEQRSSKLSGWFNGSHLAKLRDVLNQRVT